ncbi:MAG: transglutaminase family protein [Alphaproteobacteria bacterium]|nr:transglutaminase family protein [Alphaproteobacteria bacterium]
MDLNPADYLKQIGALADDQIDPGPASIALAGMRRPGLSLERYIHHLEMLAHEVSERHRMLLEAGADDDVQTQLAALKYVIYENYGYSADTKGYSDLNDADLVGVIDRRKGTPLALSILYISAAQAQGWSVSGLDMPGHFLCRLEKDGQRVIFDPFNSCTVLDAAGLRALIKKTLGPEAELSSDYYTPLSNRGILMRLQNNVKFFLIEAEDYEAASEIVETMRIFAPEEYRSLLDLGVLYARTGRIAEAVKALESYLEHVPDLAAQRDVVLLLGELKDSLEP